MVSGSGQIVLVDKGSYVAIRIGLEITSTTLGVAVTMLALAAALPTLGFAYLIFVFANDFAATSIVNELDRLADECLSYSNSQPAAKSHT